jgi:hypothetical protein
MAANILETRRIPLDVQLVPALAAWRSKGAFSNTTMAASIAAMIKTASNNAAVAEI